VLLDVVLIDDHGIALWALGGWLALDVNREFAIPFLVVIRGRIARCGLAHVWLACTIIILIIIQPRQSLPSQNPVQFGVTAR
jgi:hypothetical protein